MCCLCFKRSFFVFVSISISDVNGFFALLQFEQTISKTRMVNIMHALGQHRLATSILKKVIHCILLHSFQFHKSHRVYKTDSKRLPLPLPPSCFVLQINFSLSFQNWHNVYIWNEGFSLFEQHKTTTFAHSFLLSNVFPFLFETVNSNWNCMRSLFNVHYHRKICKKTYVRVHSNTLHMSWSVQMKYICNCWCCKMCTEHTVARPVQPIWRKW